MFCIPLVFWLSYFISLSPTPVFEAQTVDANISIGYGLALADVDGDGDLDLFVGGRLVPGAYPQGPVSRLFRNEHGRLAESIETEGFCRAREPRRAARRQSSRV